MNKERISSLTIQDAKELLGPELWREAVLVAENMSASPGAAMEPITLMVCTLYLLRQRVEQLEMHAGLRPRPLPLEAQHVGG